MKKRMKSYYGWFPALFLLTLLCCLPKAVSALRPSQPQEPAPVVEPVPEVPETVSSQEPSLAAEPDVPEQEPEETIPQPERTPVEPAKEEPVIVPEEPVEEEPPQAVTVPEEPAQDPPEVLPSQDPEPVQEEPASVSEDQIPSEEVTPESLNSFFSDTLFIGDSRTVGLCEYSGLTTATFFSDVGMSVYKVLNNQVSVSGYGQITLEKLLQEKTFGKIHLMLGINELGYDLNTTITTYSSIVDTIRALQPDAVIYLGGNLHVGKYRSDTDTIINNPAIDRFNSAVAGLADGETIFYVDVNPLFDDDSGNLRTDCSGDGTHVYGSCYPQWAQWLYSAMQTAA